MNMNYIGKERFIGGEMELSEIEKEAIEQLKKLLHDFDNEDISETDLFLINRLIEKQQKELKNNTKFKKDIVNLIMLWDKKNLPENNVVIEVLETIIHEFSRLENIEDEKIQVAAKFIEEKRDKYWKDKIRKKIKELENKANLYNKIVDEYEYFCTLDIIEELKKILGE